MSVAQENVWVREEADNINILRERVLSHSILKVFALEMVDENHTKTSELARKQPVMPKW